MIPAVEQALAAILQQIATVREQCPSLTARQVEQEAKIRCRGEILLANAAIDRLEMKAVRRK